MSSLSSDEPVGHSATDLLRETAAVRNRHRHEAGTQGAAMSGSNPSSLEMPMKWDRDAELARKLQAEEEAAVAALRTNQNSKPSTSTAPPPSNGRQPAPTAAPVASPSSQSSSMYPNLSAGKAAAAPSAPYSPHVPIYPSIKPHQERPQVDLGNDRPPAQVPGATAPKPKPSSSSSAAPQSKPFSLEMPMKYDRDAELARKLQAEEEAAAARGGGHLSAAAQAERKRREEEDAAMARQLMQKEREALEAAEADERLARQMQAKEEAIRNSRGRREAEEVDAALARSLQLAEQQEQRGSDRSNSPISAPRRSRRNISGDDNDGSDGVVLTDSSAIAREMEREAASERNRRELDEIHRRHAERNRLQQAQNSIDVLVNNGNNPGGAASSSSVSHPRRTREELIDRLHELQGDYSSFAPDGEGRVTRFRFAPDGRILVNLEQDPNAAPDSEANRRAIAQAATEGIDDEPEQVPRMDEDASSDDEDGEQRAAFEEFEREHQLRQQQPTTLLGVFGNMLHRYMTGRQGVPFTFVASSGNNPRLRPAGLSFRRSFGGGGAASIDVDRLGYEELLALEEALGSVKPRVKAAKEEDLEQLPVRVYTKPAASSSSSSANAANSESVECCICLSEFEEGDMVKTLPCMHQFHEAEIDKWLLTNEKCPTCQRPVTKVE